MPRKHVKIDVYGKEILELKREGKTNREIAQKLGVDRKCIRNWVFGSIDSNESWRQVSSCIQKAGHGKMLSQETL